MPSLALQRGHWLRNDLEDPAEGATLVELCVKVGDAILTRNFDLRGGGSSESINVPLYPLAQLLADNWWTTLYEPFRAGNLGFRSRHRLDGAMHGYVFPALTICSGGDTSLLISWAKEMEENSLIEFAVPLIDNPIAVERGDTETTLMDVVETSLERLNGGEAAASLAESWNRVLESLSDPDELAYCRVAGRLGFDPYDPDSPDITQYADGIDQNLFDDVSDAAFLEEIPETVTWLRDRSDAVRHAPSIEVSGFGDSPTDDIDVAPWMNGASAARRFREATGFDEMRPREELERVLGEVVLSKATSFRQGPRSLSSIISRDGARANLSVIARSAREQRFKSTAAAYLAWTATNGQRAGTLAYTRRQQTARAFSAELLAPIAYLRANAPQHGLTAEDIEMLAGRLTCPHDTVLWQAIHANIPLRGQPLPPSPYGAMA